MNKTDLINEKILDILIPSASRDSRSVLASIQDKDWHYILDRGCEHRFLPLMHWTLEQADALGEVPHEVEKAMSDARRCSTFRALEAQREIVLLHRLFFGADIPHVFLKGAYLLQFAYPHSGLRPVRDIDVVVAPDCISRAYNLLKEHGYASITDNTVDIPAYVKQTKHLPGLLSPTGRFCVEVHTLVDRPGGKLSGLDALHNINVKYVGRDAIPFMDPNDLFIHLCVHAADFHEFNNGPLIITDIGFLLQSGAIDLHRVAARAAELGVAKSVALTLALTESCWQLKGNTLPTLFEPVPEEVIQDARQLCFRRFDNRANVALGVELFTEDTFVKRIFTMMEKIFPSADKLALEFGPFHSRAEYVPRLVRRWRRVLTERLPSFWESQNHATYQYEIYRVTRLRRWLK